MEAWLNCPLLPPGLYFGDGSRWIGRNFLPLGSLGVAKICNGGAEDHADIFYLGADRAVWACPGHGAELLGEIESAHAEVILELW